MTWWASDNHTEVRRAVAPAFMGKALQGYQPAMEEVARRMTRELPTGTPSSFTLRADDGARSDHVSRLPGSPNQRRAQLSDYAGQTRPPDRIEGMALPAAMVSRGRWLPFPTLDRVLRASIESPRRIAARRAGSDTDRSDCLAVFLRIQESHERSLMDDEMIAGFQRLLLVAGNDTTAATLSWVIERLARRPQVLARLEESVAAGGTRTSTR